MSSRKIITFSGRMRSGKDMLCEAIKNVYGSETFSLATHLKRLCCAVLDVEIPFLAPWNIETLNKWKNNRGIIVNEPIPLSPSSINVISEYTNFKLEDVFECCDGLGFRSVRELVQCVGTDVIRQIDSSWHIKMLLKDIDRLPEGTIVCVDDIRFPNELEAFRKAGADTFFIIRTNSETVSNHESEISLTHSDFTDDNIIINNSDITAISNSFLSKYQGRFQLKTDTSLFLSDYPKYRDVNRTFGCEKTELVEEILRQNAKNELFLKDGLITFRNNVNFKLKEVLNEMDIVDTYQYEQINGRFVIDNPIAYENLKQWL